MNEKAFSRFVTQLEPFPIDSKRSGDNSLCAVDGWLCKIIIITYTISGPLSSCVHLSYHLVDPCPCLPPPLPTKKIIFQFQ